MIREYLCSTGYMKTRFNIGGSFLDIFIVDSRLIIHETGNSVNCLETLDYDSDHNAVKMVVSRNTQAEPLDFLQSSVTRTLDFKRTDWKKFEKLIMQALNNDSFIPANRNLSNDEIIFHVERLNNIITNAIDKSVPSFKEKDRLKELLNPVIKTLQKEKSRILTVIKKHNRFQNVLNPTVLCFMKNRLKMVRKLLQDNFVISMNKKLEQKFNKINSSNPSTMFSEAKKILRNRKADNINILKIPPEDMCLLHRAEIDHRTLRIENGSDKYVLEDEGHILNFIGAYLESIYSSKSTDETNLVHREVIEVFNSFLEDKVRYEEGLNTITNFNDMNLANDPVASNLDYFTSREEILYIFSKLKGKLSYGIDKIPNIILKKVPMLLIFEYLTLFNNMINNAFFPKHWKIAKMVVIPKKDRDITHPKNLRAISLLPNISKIFEICSNNIISQQCLKLNLVCEKQFGFKHTHSTIH
uniref:Endonuclease/exonuclease/phosphatase domain-containing protein n=1 Tax=Stomoxys calcitrans TaxID=35570 RepID=A0A1I8PE37_STOCA